MNSKDLLKAIGNIDDKYLIEKDNDDNKIESNKVFYAIKKLKYFIVPICTIFIVTIVVYKSKILSQNSNVKNVDILDSEIKNTNKENKWIEKEIQQSSNTSNAEITTVPKWEEMTISQQFLTVKYNDNSYSSRVTKISKNDLLKNIGSSVSTGYDTYNKINYTKNVELYSIKNISEECAIAIQFENDDDYYVYVNSYYRPANLEQFINDLNLENNISFGTIHYNYWDTSDKDNPEYINVEFYDVKDDIIWKMLFNDKNLENIYSDKDSWKYRSERFTSEISISIDIPILGYKNISVTLTDKGYLITNILDTGKGFYIGENKVNEFLEYISDNYDGYKLVRVTDEEDEIPESEKEQDIVMYDKSTNTVTNVTVNSDNKVANFTKPYNPMEN